MTSDLTFLCRRCKIHDAEISGRPSVITDALKQKVNRIIRENRHFTVLCRAKRSLLSERPS